MKHSIRDSIILRMGIVAILVLVLLVPVSFVSGLICERQQTRDYALREVTEKWGQKQTIVGPILTVPVKRTFRNTEGVLTWTSTESVHFLPDSLVVNARLAPEVRYRGIYKVLLYNSQMRVEADFAAPEFKGDLPADGEIQWTQAFLTIGVSDLRGVRGINSAVLGDQPLTPEPGAGNKDLVNNGFTFRTPLAPGETPARFVLEANINGSEEICFVPVGKQTRVSASAQWGDPSFIGSFLPEKREITDHSFNSQWNIIHLSRNLPQTWTGAQPRLTETSFGVKLLLPVDEYQKNSRAVKYAIMFIALTFLAFCMVDVLSTSPFHPIHYTLAGFALILFFVLLLSVSEHISFNFAYLIASVPVILLIAMYTRGVTRRWSATGAIAGVLTLLYVFLFVLLQLSDYSLLLGSSGLFAGLALIMYLTRRIDWFGSEKIKEDNSGPGGLPEHVL
ncbi:MAG: cell envelope integrity protein CreD [Syntrophobacteraceae bacterium]